MADAMLHLQKHGIQFRAFREPDRNNELTAISTEPISGEMRKHLRKYRLSTGEHIPLETENEFGWTPHRAEIRRMVREFSKD